MTTIISPNIKKESVRIDTQGNIINPATKQVIQENTPEYIPPAEKKEEVKEEKQDSLSEKINALVEQKIKAKIDEIVEKRVEEALKGI